MESDIEKVKRLAIEDKEFVKSFSGVTSIIDAVDIAKDKGFNISKEDVLNDKELSEELLVAAAGGKGDHYEQKNIQQQNITNVVNGSNNVIHSDHHSSASSNGAFR